MSETAVIAGGCQCGAVRWRATAPPKLSTICHCENCRRAGGAQCVAWWTFEIADVVVEGPVRGYRTDNGGLRAFCPRCGSQLTYVGARRPHEIDVTVGTADNANAYPPTADNFPEDRLRWVVPVAHDGSPGQNPGPDAGPPSP